MSTHAAIDRLRANYPWPDQRPDFQPIPWSQDAGGQRLVKQVIRRRGLRVILEIGVFLGGSAKVWLDEAPQAIVVGLDPWSPRPDWAAYARQNGKFRQELVRRLHARGVAYVDLHKLENVLVGDDGFPYLVDFQISVGLPAGWLGRLPPLGTALRLLQRSDDYRVLKQFALCRPDLCGLTFDDMQKHRPWRIRGTGWRPIRYECCGGGCWCFCACVPEEAASGRKRVPRSANERKVRLPHPFPPRGGAGNVMRRSSFRDHEIAPRLRSAPTAQGSGPAANVSRRKLPKANSIASA